MKNRFVAMLALWLCWAAIPAFAAGYTQTQYPIVLAHGMFGFDSIV
mgnify:FL=1